MRIEDEIKQPTFRDEYQKAHINLVYTAGWMQLRQAAAFQAIWPHAAPISTFCAFCAVSTRCRPRWPCSSTACWTKPATPRALWTSWWQKVLVTRTVCPTNRRAVDIRITKAGLELLRSMESVVSSQNTGLQNLS